MINSTSEILNKGMKCLTEQMGIIEAEQFDYTKWQREYFDTKTSEEISVEAVKFEKKHPYKGKAYRL